MPPALGHHQEQLMQTSTVLSFKTHLFLLFQILEGGRALLRHPFTTPLALGKLPSFLVSKYSVPLCGPSCILRVRELWRRNSITPGFLDKLALPSFSILSTIAPNGLSDLKQNGTQEKKIFSGTVWLALLHGVIRFVAIVSFKNYQMEASNLLLKSFNHSEQKRITLHERP